MRQGPTRRTKCSYATDVERRKVFRRRRDIARSKHRDLPKNCYTQADCDTYAYENNYCEVPNPAWLEPNAPIEGCVPSSLIPFKIRAEQRRAYVDQQQDWREFDAYADLCILHNRDNDARCMVRTTPSQENRPRCPSDWPGLRATLLLHLTSLGHRNVSKLRRRHRLQLRRVSIRRCWMISRRWASRPSTRSTEFRPMNWTA